jgi:hypothetical protein
MAGFLAFGAACNTARADGGTVRLSRSVGGYRVTALTAPALLRSGPVEVSVLVQDAATGTLVSDARVHVRMWLRARPEITISEQATSDAATNKLYRGAIFQVPEPGTWDAEVAVEGAQGTGRVRFEMDVGAPLPRWVALWPWISWPALVALLYGVHQYLVMQRSRRRVL